MCCPCNKKKWLGLLEYEDEHVDDIHNIREITDGPGSAWKYTVHCQLCKRWKWRSASHSDMVRMKLVTLDGDIIGETPETPDADN